MQSLSSKMFSPRPLRYYSTHQSALKLWVKHNGGPPTQVPINGCTNIDDFAEKVKQKLNTNCQVSVFSSLEKEALKPWLSMEDVLKTDYSKKNSGDTPLFVKLIPVTQDSIASKTIYIRDIDDDGKITDEYIKYEVKNHAELRDIYKNGRGLVHLSNPKKPLSALIKSRMGKSIKFSDIRKRTQSLQRLYISEILTRNVDPLTVIQKYWWEVMQI